MSRNGTGTYNLPAGNPVVTGTTISSSWANNTLADIASALTDSIAADGQTPMTGDLDMNSQKLVNVANGTLPTDGINLSQLTTATTVVAITGGTINGATIGETTRSSGKFTTLAANGATTLTSTLGVTGATTLSNTLDVTGAATFTSNSAFNGTGALKIPVGTTGQQPTPTTGMIRYDSTLNEFQGYYASTWGAIGGVAAGSNTQIQYNNGGVLAGSSALTFNGTNLITTTLQSTNISDGTNSTSTTNCVLGSAKAWVYFYGGASGTTSGQVIKSFNVSSVTVVGTGNWTINFTNALADTNYVVVGSNDGLGGTSNYVTTFGANLAGGQYSTTACSCAVVSSSGAGINTQFVRAVFFD